MTYRNLNGETLSSLAESTFKGENPDDISLLGYFGNDLTVLAFLISLIGVETGPASTITGAAVFSNEFSGGVIKVISYDWTNYLLVGCRGSKKLF